MLDVNKENVGFGKSKQADGSGLVQVWVEVRRDREIPDFDAVSEFKYQLEGFDASEELMRLEKMLTEHMGMFVNDVFQLTERDLGLESPSPFAPLRAVKKALANYLDKTGQNERLRRVTERVVCSCRHVTDFEIREAIKKGKTTFELIRAYTGAGSGCGSCEKRVCDFLTLGDK